MDKVIIHWRSTLTGATGHGKPITRFVAEAWIKYLAPKYPNLIHWIEPA